MLVFTPFSSTPEDLLSKFQAMVIKLTIHADSCKHLNTLDAEAVAGQLQYKFTFNGTLRNKIQHNENTIK